MGRGFFSLVGSMLRATSKAAKTVNKLAGTDEPARRASRRAEAHSFPGATVPHMLPNIGRQSVSGEYYHLDAIRAAVRNHERELMPIGKWGQTYTTTADVRREPTNPHDANAVAVIIANRLVGYIPSGDTYEWQKLLTRLETEDEYAVATASIYLNGDGYTIVLHATPSVPDVLNAAPSGRQLPAEWGVAISGEENVQPLLAGYGADSWVWAQLTTGTIEKGKYAGHPTFYAAIDGQTAGCVSALQAERYLRLVTSSLPCYCLAYIKQGPKKLEVELMLPSMKS